MICEARHLTETPDIAQVWDAEGLIRVTAPGVTLCLWPRSPPAELARFLTFVAAQGPLSVDRYAADGALDADTLLDGFAWSSHPGRRLWTEDLRLLLGVYQRAAGPGPVRVQISRVDKVDCPVFHTDSVQLRLLCTYHGAGTEYAAARHVDRGALCRPLETRAATNRAIVPDPRTIRRMETFDVGIFKGDRWDCRADSGIVHRSPPHEAGAEPRIKLVIDHTNPL